MESQQLTEEQLQKILDIKNDFYRYCKNNLKIKDKRLVGCGCDLKPFQKFHGFFAIISADVGAGAKFGADFGVFGGAPDGAF